MKYFSVSISDDLKIIGNYPQTKLRTDSGDNVRIDGYLAMEANKFPDFMPNFKLELHEKAIPTNFLPISPASFGWIVDDKLKSIIEKHKLPRHHFYKIKVYHKNEILIYYWFHYIIDDFYEFIDKSKSYGEVYEFKNTTKAPIKKIETVVKETFPIHSWDQVLKEKKKHGYNTTRIGKIVMKDDFPKYDIYETRCINYITIISENLRNDSIKEGMTGFETKLYNKFQTTD